MAQQGAERRLTTILAADVVGYSRLIATDESGTLNALKSLRGEIMDPTIARYKGRVVKLMGDGTLVEFNSVVDAVGFAIGFQEKMIEFNAGVQSANRIDFRIGINIGDIVVEGDDIYGDAVNIAARLEGLSEAGGICVSSSVVDHVKGKLDVTFSDCGEQKVKNIPGLLRVYKIIPEKKSDTTTDIPQPSLLKDFSGENNLVVKATEIDLTIPDSPSIAVLPFSNMSADPEQEFFSDGITEDIITALSKINDLLVVARNSTFIYKGQAIDVKQVSREQGVRFVLEGSVRKAANRVRVTAQLIDATTGHHRWAERYDRNLEDIFAVQDEITREVVIALDVKLRGGDQAIAWSSGTRNLEAWENVRRGMEVLNSVTPESPQEAEKLFKRALQLDSQYSMAWVGLGWACHHGVELRVGDFSEEEWKSAHDLTIKHGQKALELDPANPDAYSLLSLCYLSKFEYDLAIAMSEKAVILSPGHAEILGVAAIVLNKSGQPDRALEFIKRAMRHCPIYPSWFLLALGTAYRLTDQADVAINTFEVGASRSVDFLALHVNLASTLGEVGRQTDAKRTVSEILRLDPKFSIKQYIANMSYRDTHVLEHFSDGLRKVGLPD